MDRYEQLSVVGEGSYGLVMKCRHKETDQIVAIKKFLETEEDAAVRRMALREIRMLKKLRHENLVTMIEVFRYRKRFYLVFEYLDGTVLDELEKTPGGLGDDQSRERIFQILRAIQYCHSNQIIHRDIKPENVLVSAQGIVKLCDFGFARLIGVNGEPCTEYVATRWYRAPELLVSEQQYGYAVDIWAIGCLFAEMMTGDPLFPGESDIDQLFLIVKMLGKPCLRHQQAMSRSIQLRGLMRSAAVDCTGLYREYPNWPLLALDFLSATVKMDPSLRPSAEDLLAHNYFTHDKFPARFLPEVRERVNKEFEENPLLSRYRVEILMSTDKRDEAIRQTQQAQRRATQIETQRWRFNLLEGSIKRKYSYDTNISDSPIKPADTRGVQKLNFIRRGAQNNQNAPIKNTNRKFDTNKESIDSITNTTDTHSNDIQKLERSLENLTKLSMKRSNSAQNDSNKSRESSPTLFQSLQPHGQEDIVSQSMQKNVQAKDSGKEIQNLQVVPNGNQTLQPSIHNISFERLGKGNEFVKKTSPNLLQSIQNIRGINHTNIPILTPQPRGSQMFLKRLDRNAEMNAIQPNVSQPQIETASNLHGVTLSNQNCSISNTGLTGHMHSQNSVFLARKRDKGSIFSSIGTGYFQSDGNLGKNMSDATIMSILTAPHIQPSNKPSVLENNGSNSGTGDSFSLPMLPGATHTPMKRLAHISNSLTLYTLTPRILSATSQKRQI